MDTIVAFCDPLAKGVTKAGKQMILRGHFHTISNVSCII